MRFNWRPKRNDRARLGRRSFVVLMASASCGAWLTVLRGAQALADESAAFRLIVHPENPSDSLSRGFLVEAFLKTTTHWDDGEAIRAVDQRADSPIRRVFTEVVLKRSVAAVRSYWQQRIFSGRDVPPPELDSDDDVVDFVLGHRGGVGYVSTAAKLRDAKVVVVR